MELQKSNIEILYVLNKEIFIKSSTLDLIPDNFKIYNISKKRSIDILYAVQKFHSTKPTGQFYIGFKPQDRHDKLILRIECKGIYFEQKTFII